MSNTIPNDPLLDESLANPDKPPLACASGDDAARFIREWIDTDITTDELIDKMNRESGLRGRPSLGGNRQPSEYESFRRPKSWDGYIERAVEREGFATKSEYYRYLVMEDARRHNEEAELLPA